MSNSRLKKRFGWNWECACTQYCSLGKGEVGFKARTFGGGGGNRWVLVGWGMGDGDDRGGRWRGMRMIRDADKRR